MSLKLFLQLAAVLFIHIAAFFVVNPTDILMPYDMWMGLTLVFILIAAAFSVFVVAEGRGDERENAHRSIAGRVAFFVGALVMVIGVSYQAHQNNSVDPWLLLALCAMITSKVVARLIVSRTH